MSSSDSYFTELAQIWTEWFQGRENPGHGALSMKEREERIANLRADYRREMPYPEKPKPRINIKLEI